jgi:hypothetical protein
MSNTASNSFQRWEDWRRTLGTRMLSAALDLHERGLVVIPLQPRSEEPLLNWKELQGNKPTVEQINGWFAQEPEIKIGIITGALSGIVVLVAESGSYGHHSHNVPCTTPLAHTKKAEYYYFKHPGIIVQSKRNLVPGMHLVGDGAFVVAPPSVDGSGYDYEWCRGLDERPLDDMPEKLMNLLARKGLLEDGRVLGVTMEPPFDADNQSPQSPTPPAASDNITSSSNRTLTLLKASDIEPESIDWLWPGVLAKGKVSMLIGDPGISKSQLAIGMAATVSNGGSWPASTGTAKKGKVIILSAEDGEADTIVPRLLAAEADRNEVFIHGPATGPAGERLSDLDQDLSRLKAQMDGGVSLIIIDPITAYLGKKDANKIGDVRGILAKLAQLAESSRTCVLAISHLNKDGAKKAVYRAIGSVGFSAAARTVFMVVKDASDPNRHIMAPVKSNIGPDTDGSVILPKGIKTSKVVFEETVHRTTADELLSERSEGGGEALNEAKEFLKTVLGDGPFGSNLRS